MSRATQDTDRHTPTNIQGYHLILLIFPDDSVDLRQIYVCPTTPILPEQDWFGLFPVRSPLLRESLIVFYSSGYLDVSVHRVSTINGDMSSTCRVTPFGNPYLNDYLHLSMAYRSLSRPSSLLRAKASANCSLLLMIYSIFYQYVKELLFSGEYRSRTDDLLRARQALQPAELIPHLYRSPEQI